MKIGLIAAQSQATSMHDILDQIVLAETCGYHSVWLTEKHFEKGHLLWSSPLITASYLAAKTERIKIGFSACVSTFHHPVRLAEDFANLDVLSRGRLIVGLTKSSFSTKSHDIFQSPLKKSVQKFNEQFEIMTQLWQKNFKDHRGKFYKIPETTLYPEVLQKPLPPIYLIANSDVAVIDAAQKGAGIFLHAFQTIESICAKKALYEQYFIDKLGLGPRVVMSRLAYASSTQEQAIHEIEHPFMQFLAQEMPHVQALLAKEYPGNTIDFDFFCKKLCIFGSGDDCYQQLKTISQQTGIQQLAVLMNYTTLNHDLSLESMRRFAMAEDLFHV